MLNNSTLKSANKTKGGFITFVKLNKKAATKCGKSKEN
jgi:hypothetical protein